MHKGVDKNLFNKKINLILYYMAQYVDMESQY